MPIEGTDFWVEPHEDQSRLVVYSCYFGGYEPFNLGATGDGLGYDRVVITDDPTLRAPGVRVVCVDASGFPNCDPRQLSRLGKMCPHLFFSRYEWAIYIDNGAELRCSPLDIIQQLQTDYLGIPPPGRYLFKHRMRECAYREARVCLKRLKISRKDYRQQISQYKAEGFPENHGLYVNTVMIQRMGDPFTDRINEAWFEHYLNVSSRDQISLPYIMWKFAYPERALPFSLTDLAAWPKFRAWKRDRFRRSVERKAALAGASQSDEAQPMVVKAA
jgi:hypothetical protein